MDECIIDGYEGLVIRERESPYVFSTNGKRSKTTLKYKKRLEMDVNIIDIL